VVEPAAPDRAAVDFATIEMRQRAHFRGRERRLGGFAGRVPLADLGRSSASGGSTMPCWGGESRKVVPRRFAPDAGRSWGEVSRRRHRAGVVSSCPTGARRDGRGRAGGWLFSGWVVRGVRDCLARSGSGAGADGHGVGTRAQEGKYMILAL
jgi:hypothetical protein